MFARPGSFCWQKIQVLSSGRWVFGNWICFPDQTRNGSDITVVQISDDEGKTWPYMRIIEHGEGFVGQWNDCNNRRYEYPVMMQSRDGKIYAAYSYGDRRCVKYVCVDEKWIRGEKRLAGAEGDPAMPCQR